MFSRTFEGTNRQASGQDFRSTFSTVYKGMSHGAVNVAAAAHIQRQRRIVIGVEIKHSLQHEDEFFAVVQSPVSSLQSEELRVS
jgi:hypothetical protein